MDVPLFLVADYVNTTPEGKLNVLGIFNRIFSDKFPTTHPQLYVVIQVRVKPTEQGRPFNMELLLMDQDGKRIFSASGQGNVPKLDPVGDGESVTLMALAGLTFDKPGDYAFCLTINGEERGRRELRLEKRTKPKEGV